MREQLDRMPSPYWYDGETGVKYKRYGRLVISENCVAVEDVWSQDFDRNMVGEVTGEKKPFDLNNLGTKTKRGAITDFTRASQTRMFKAMSAWKPRGHLWFLTLTYPREFPITRRAKQDFKRFTQKLRRDHPWLAGVWKLEYQIRGAPHFHMILDDAGNRMHKAYWYAYLEATWAQACKRDIGAGRSTEFKRARHAGRAKFYLSKEVGKSAQSSRTWRERIERHIKHHGRFWGWFNKKEITLRQREWALPVDAAWKARNILQNRVFNRLKRQRYLKKVDGKWMLPQGYECEVSNLQSWEATDRPEAFLEAVKKALAEDGIDFHQIAKKIEPDFTRYDDSGADIDDTS